MKRTVVVARRRVANRSINGKVFQKTGIPLEAIERGRRRKGWRTIGKGFFLKLSFSGTCLIILSLSLSLFVPLVEEEGLVANFSPTTIASSPSTPAFVLHVIFHVVV